jgi:hypothetical protein
VITGLGWLLLSFISIAVAIKYYKTIDKCDADGELAFIGLFMGAPIGAGFFLISMYYLFSIWTYVAIFEPKVYLAHQLVEKVLGG